MIEIPKLREIDQETELYKKYLVEQKVSKITVKLYAHFIREYYIYIEEKHLEDDLEGMRRFIRFKDYTIIKSRKWAFSVFKNYLKYKRSPLLFDVERILSPKKLEESK